MGVVGAEECREVWMLAKEREYVCLLIQFVCGEQFLESVERRPALREVKLER